MAAYGTSAAWATAWDHRRRRASARDAPKRKGGRREADRALRKRHQCGRRSPVPMKKTHEEKKRHGNATPRRSKDGARAGLMGRPGSTAFHDCGVRHSINPSIIGRAVARGGTTMRCGLEHRVLLHAVCDRAHSPPRGSRWPEHFSEAEAVRGEIVGQIAGLVGTEEARPSRRLLQARRAATRTCCRDDRRITFIPRRGAGPFSRLQAALNTIWRVTPAPGGHLKAFFLDRLRSFGLVVAIGFLLLVSLAVSAASVALALARPLGTGMPIVCTSSTSSCRSP